MAMISEVLGLKFKATVYHIGDGYFYYKNSTERNKFYLRCAVSKLCPGRGNIPRQPEARLASSLVTSRPHSHPPQPNWLDVNTLRTSILRRCETTSTPYRQIQREESESSLISGIEAAGLESMSLVPIGDGVSDEAEGDNTGDEAVTVTSGDNVADTKHDNWDLSGNKTRSIARRRQSRLITILLTSG
ncbi:hypothetical protein J6590_102255 [Homalodisca vitripennis]|nr:hypothetical protein J6590_102255 [Homalodisca vitripennis]